MPLTGLVKLTGEKKDKHRDDAERNSCGTHERNAASESASAAVGLSGNPWVGYGVEDPSDCSNQPDDGQPDEYGALRQEKGLPF